MKNYLLVGEADSIELALDSILKHRGGEMSVDSFDSKDINKLTMPNLLVSKAKRADFTVLLFNVLDLVSCSALVVTLVATMRKYSQFRLVILNSETYPEPSILTKVLKELFKQKQLSLKMLLGSPKGQDILSFAEYNTPQIALKINVFSTISSFELLFFKKEKIENCLYNCSVSDEVVSRLYSQAEEGLTVIGFKLNKSQTAYIWFNAKQFSFATLSV